jgi:hypothetical protein
MQYQTMLTSRFMIIFQVLDTNSSVFEVYMFLILNVFGFKNIKLIFLMFYNSFNALKLKIYF